MATIKFILQSKKDAASIYLRFSIDRVNVLKRKTNFIINPNNWNYSKGMPKPNDDELKSLKTTLDKLRVSIGERYNDAIKNNIPVNGLWLNEQINDIQNRKTKQSIDLSELVNYAQYFIDSLPNKVNSKGEKGVKKSTIQKYTNIKKKLEEFQRIQKKTFYLKDVDLKFRNDFIRYLNEIEHLSDNTTGRYIRFFKTICLDARENGYETSIQLGKIKGYTTKSEKIFLTFEELEQIKQKSFEREALNNAKDWLIIGCYIGQRVSDLLKLRKENISIRNGIELIELTQKKTGKIVSIPLHEEVKTILEKRKGDFPSKLSASKFNLHIKDICQLSGITQIIDGGKIDKETSRKVQGTYQKWELITSHACRRSFASNFYGDIPTALLISITGHSTEKQFLEYIGKNPTDYAVQLSEYWNKQTANALTEKQKLKKKIKNKDNKIATLKVVR